MALIGCEVQQVALCPKWKQAHGTYDTHTSSTKGRMGWKVWIERKNNNNKKRKNALEDMIIAADTVGTFPRAYICCRTLRG